jgi:hypothetical protein
MGLSCIQAAALKSLESCIIEVIGEMIARETTEECRKQMNGGNLD